MRGGAAAQLLWPLRPSSNCLGLELEAPVLDGRPLEALVIGGEGEGDAHGGDPLEAHQLAVVVLRLRRPLQEGDDVLGHLRARGGGTVLKVEDTVLLQWRRHADPPAGEVRVVPLRLARGHAGWRLLVAREQGEDVVRAVVPGLDDEREIRGIGASVGVPRRLLVGIGRWQIVGQLARALEHLALVVRAVHNIDLLRQRLHLVLRVAHVDEVAECDAVERVARGADLCVHLVPAPDGSGVVAVEEPVKSPRVRRWVQHTVVGERDRRREGRSCRDRCR
mmetsp:Transcript_20375/g.52631  ORF Transcript_20375/g.52631 Transcript_20375/m.52631 type:complete len:278 (+) Transcript_20375:294-1127(+)